MPRDANGDFAYTPSTVAPAVGGTVIDATDFNDLAADLATEMQDSLSRSGKGGMLVPFENAAGTSASPGVTFSGDNTAGLFLDTGDVGVSVGGTEVVRATATGVEITGDLTVSGLINGGSAAPQTSSSCGTFSTTSAVPVDVTNLTVTITTQGRPVLLMIQAESTGGGLPYGVGGSTDSIYVNLVRDGVTRSSSGSVINASSEMVAPLAAQFIDVAVAGTYVYKIQGYTVGGATLFMTNCVLIAVEL